MQGAADPGLTRVAGPGLSRAVAGAAACFVIDARDETGSRRLSGGDAFAALLLAVGSLPPQQVGLHELQACGHSCWVGPFVFMIEGCPL